MLQLVYHAPPQIAKQALKLLKAIRSPAIIPELKAMFLDEEYDVHLRREVYRAICALRGNFDFSEFEPVMGSIFGFFELPSFFELIKNHPTNKEWMIHYLEVKPRFPLSYFYSSIIEYVPEIVTERILKALSEAKFPVGKHLGFQLRKYGDQNSQIWLEKNMDTIVRLWLTDDIREEGSKYSVRLRDLIAQKNWLNQWPELKSALGMLTSETLLTYLEGERIIRQKSICMRLLPYAPKVASEPLLKLFDEKQVFLDLEVAGLLHEYGDEIVQSWLTARWDELIYLCLIDSIGIQNQSERMQLVHVLEKWPELKEAVFRNCPAMIEEYEEIKTTENPTPSPQVSDNYIKASSIWQEIKKRRDEWVEKTEIGEYNPIYSHHLAWNALKNQSDIPQYATEAYFLGTILPYSYKYFGNDLRQLLRRSPDQWLRVVKVPNDPEMTFVYSPIRFEAAYAIRNVIESLNWECMVEAFLMCVDEVAETPASLEDNLFRWISRMTDMLSGVEPELPDEEIPLKARPWFCALVQQESNMPKV